MKNRLSQIFAAALFIVALGRPANADLIFNAVESGGNVVISGGGTVDLDGLTYLFSTGTGSGVISSEAFFGFGGATDDYFGFSGPTSFGAAGPKDATSSSGSAFSISGLAGALKLPVGYVSGSQLSSTATYNGATFATLGMTPGTYVWTWGAGAHADSLTLNIGEQAIPEPSTCALAGALGFLGLVARHRRRRQ